MKCKRVTLPTPQENLAYDVALLRLAEDGQSGSVLRFWESPEVFVVLGRVGRADEDVYAERTLSDGVPVLRRSSGGGTVLQGPGCLNYSLIIGKDHDRALRDLHRSYEWISGKIVRALHAKNIRSTFRPPSDIVLTAGELKFSGNAQRRLRNTILHHGTLLYNFDLALITKYLRLPVSMPDYRCRRAHRDFVCNLPVTRPELESAVEAVFPLSAREDVVTAVEQDALQQQPVLEV